MSKATSKSKREPPAVKEDEPEIPAENAAAATESTAPASAPAKPSAARDNYTVLARRYRPQQFDECIGQEHVAQSLKNAIQLGRVAHAYLFTGSRGVGKTSMARIFAKALNCKNGPTITPCDQCDICQSIAAGEDVDVLEIDGASNRGIDEIRSLRQNVNFRPSRSHYKIYIIDEVHMLTKEAFNALLKTLEEPPGHTKFLFATTEPQKIPITILSRCQRFDFSGVDQPRIMERLRQIVESEGMQAEDEALEIVARRAAGSMRDSQSLLDQVLAFGSDRLTAEEVHRVLGTASDDRVQELANASLSGDAKRCLELVADATIDGVQLGEWIEQMLDYLRDLMVLGVDPQASMVSMSNRHRPKMLEQAKARAAERILERMDLLAACRARMQSSTYARTLLEMTLVRMCRLDQFMSLKQAVTQGPPDGFSAAPAQNPAPRSSSPAAMSQTQAAPASHNYESKKNFVTESPTRSTQSFGNQQTSPAPVSSSAQPEAVAADVPKMPVIDFSAETLSIFWSAANARLDDIGLNAMLSKSKERSIVPPNILQIAFPADARTVKEYCELPARIARLEHVCSELAGKRIGIKMDLLASTGETAPVARKPTPGELRDLAMKDTLVANAERIFKAKVVGVEQAVSTARAARSEAADAGNDGSNEQEKGEA